MSTQASSNPNNVLKFCDNSRLAVPWAEGILGWRQGRLWTLVGLAWFLGKRGCRVTVSAVQSRGRKSDSCVLRTRHDQAASGNRGDLDMLSSQQRHITSPQVSSVPGLGAEPKLFLLPWRVLGMVLSLYYLLCCFFAGVSPFSGATTGTGGRIRDVQCTGRGAHVVAGTAGYCFGNLHIPGFTFFFFSFFFFNLFILYM